MASPDISTAVEGDTNATVDGSEDKISLKIESPTPGEQTTVVNDAKEQEPNGRTDSPVKEENDNTPESDGLQAADKDENLSETGGNADNVETNRESEPALNDTVADGGQDSGPGADDTEERPESQNTRQTENSDNSGKLDEAEDKVENISDNSVGNDANEPVEEATNDIDSDVTSTLVPSVESDTVEVQGNGGKFDELGDEQGTVEKRPEPETVVLETQDALATVNSGETEIADTENVDPSKTFEEKALEDVSEEQDTTKQIEEQEAELFLTNQEAEKQVMHELIDETVVLEKDIGNLEKKLHDTEAQKADLEAKVQPLKEATETQQVKIKHLEEELTQARMGDGEQRKALESAQQKIRDLEHQLQRLAKDDNAKAQKVKKLEIDLNESNEKVIRLEKENSAANPSQPPRSGACVIM